MKSILVLAYSWCWFVQGVQLLKCKSGTHVTVGNRNLMKTMQEQSCSKYDNPSCLSVEAEIIFSGIKAKVYVGACQTDCEKEAQLDCIEVLGSLGDSYFAHNLTKCNISCCKSSDYCNVKPLPTPNIPVSDTQCYRGVSEISPVDGVLSDTIKPEYCPLYKGQKAACIDATVWMDGGTEKTKGKMNLKQCHPANKCKEWNCNYLLKTFSYQRKAMVAGCETSCCVGNLCNNAYIYSGNYLLTNFLLLFSFITTCHLSW